MNDDRREKRQRHAWSPAPAHRGYVLHGVISAPFAKKRTNAGRNKVQPSDRTRHESEGSEREERHFARAFLWIGVGIGVVGVGAAVAYAIATAVARAHRPAGDPTSQRIQELIDEANSLLKTLDEQRNSA
jgi:hypothetical protein